MSTSEQDNIEIVKEKIRNYLKRKGFVIDGPFVGDCIKWVGVYTRPMNRSIYEEESEQVWFEWVIVGTDIVDFD